MYGGVPMGLRDLVQEALNRCCSSETPLATLAWCCDDLRQAGWNQADVRQLEAAVVGLLGTAGLLPLSSPM